MSRPLRYILFHHQTTTCKYWPFGTKCCVISSFITKPQLMTGLMVYGSGCVISSFITKPQLYMSCFKDGESCVISSFITKPQLRADRLELYKVALYPLSSPNHNRKVVRLDSILLRYILFHHQTTTEKECYSILCWLRYILFHHQTTTESGATILYQRLRYILFHHQTTT